MTGNDTIVLPASGLAEDILGSFLETKQAEADKQARSAEEDNNQEMYHLVTFFIGREEFGVDIASVQEIIRATDITPVPGAPPHVRGVINLRGKIIPVVNLRRRFGLPDVEDTEAQRIVVTELGEKRIGMLVDSVSQVIKVKAAAVEEMPEEATSVDDSYIRGVGKLDSRLIIILDLNRSLLAIQL